MFGKKVSVSVDQNAPHEVPREVGLLIRDTVGAVLQANDRLDKAAEKFKELEHRVEMLDLHRCGASASVSAIRVRQDELRDELDASRKAVEIAFKAERGIRVIQDQILVSLLQALGYKAVYDEKKKEFVVKKHSPKSNRVDKAKGKK